VITSDEEKILRAIAESIRSEWMTKDPAADGVMKFVEHKVVTDERLAKTPLTRQRVEALTNRLSDLLVHLA
jgi:hypothetical protein